MELAYEFTYDAVLAPKVPVGEGAVRQAPRTRGDRRQSHR